MGKSTTTMRTLDLYTGTLFHGLGQALVGGSWHQSRSQVPSCRGTTLSPAAEILGTHEKPQAGVLLYRSALLSYFLSLTSVRGWHESTRRLPQGPKPKRQISILAVSGITD